MSLKDMVKRQNEIVVLEFAKFGPNNSDFPVNVWFDRDNPSHRNSPRVKVQHKKGNTKSDEFISFDPKDYKFFQGKGDKHDSVPPKILDDIVDFVKDNQDLVDQYYGIDRVTGRCDVNKSSMTEDEFRGKISAAAKDYFSNKE